MNTGYLCWMIGSALVCTGLGCFLTRRLRGGLKVTLLTLLLGGLLGFAGAKLLYYLTQIDFMIADGWFRSLFVMDPTTFGFFGGALGLVLGAYLAAKCAGIRPMEALDALAPAGALMAALARLSGWMLQNEMVGIGEFTDVEALCRFPFATTVDMGYGWYENYLAVFMLEGVLCLIVFALSLCCFRGKRFLRTVFWLCLPQVACETMHANSISWLFVRVEMVLSMLFVGIVLAVYIVRLCRLGQRKQIWFPVIAWLVGVGIVIGAEFALDKSPWPILLIYAVLVTSLAAVGAAEIYAVHALKKAEAA